MPIFICRLTFPQYNSWSEQSEQTVTCGQVYGSMKPCMDYLSGKEAAPAPACCAGVRAVKGMAQTTEDKRATCSCLKQAAQSIEDLKDSVAQNLPTTCNVQLDVPISRTVDCTKWVHFLAHDVYQLVLLSRPKVNEFYAMTGLHHRGMTTLALQ